MKQGSRVFTVLRTLFTAVYGTIIFTATSLDESQLSRWVLAHTEVIRTKILQKTNSIFLMKSQKLPTLRHRTE